MGLVQRVRSASVTVGGEVVGAIGPGLCVLVGVTHDDGPEQARKLAEKIWHLRVMDDADGVMNLSVADTTREVLVVSQFTLYGDTAGGRRPSWIAAARPEHAEPLVQAVIDHLRAWEPPWRPAASAPRCWCRWSTTARSRSSSTSDAPPSEAPSE